jgi:hypothetical protein
MAESNWEARDIFSLGPKYRIDVANPQMGSDGSDVYNMYAVNDSKDIALLSLSEGGTYRIYNERTIEMVAGIKNKETGIDILISGKNGDVSILAERNGRVRIKAHNIMIEADEDIDMVAGRNINLKSGSGRILLEGNKCDAKGLTGNLIEDSFGINVFEGSFVGFDLISSAFSLGTSLLGGGGLGSILGGGLLGDLAGGLTGGLTGGLGGIVGGLTGGLTGGLGGVVGGLTGGLTGGLGGVVGGLTSGLTGGLGDLAGGLTSGLTSGLTGGLGDLAGGLTSGLTSGLTGGLGDLAGGLTSGLTGSLTSGLGGIAGDLAGGLTSGLSGSLGNIGSSLITGGINSATSALSSGALGNLGDIEETVNLIRSVSGR